MATIATEWLGRRTTDAAIAANYNSERDKDITGKSFSVDTVGVKTTTFEVIINGKSDFAQFVYWNAARNKELSALEFPVIVMHNNLRIGTGYATGKPHAYKTTAVAVPGDIAPGNAELRVTVEVAFTGVVEYGTFEPGAHDPAWDWSYPSGTFTVETSEPAPSERHYKTGDASREDLAIFYIVPTI